MIKHIQLSVTEFSLPSPLTGSIDSHSGFSEGKEVGIQLHKEIQAHREQTYPSYTAEVFVKHQFKYKNYIFDVRGRMDGMYQTDKIIIEEIKSAFNLNKLKTYISRHIQTHPFCLQLMTYGYIHWLKNNEIPLLNLHLVSSRNKKSVDLGLTLNIDDYESWLKRRFIDLTNQIQVAEKRIKFRKTMAKKFSFPFSKARGGQAELMQTVKEGFENNQATLIQAPTGLGKTMGILFPVLKEAMSRGQKVIYITPKNSQHIIAQDAVKKLQKMHLNNAMTLTAKSKLCFKSQPICNSEFCEFAKDYHTKVSENKLVAELNKIKNLTADNFKEIGLKYQVCPFELQMDNIANTDTLICDYNYVFSPQASAGRIGKIFLGENEKPNLIIDEFHNLPERGMSYYSPILSAFTLKNWMLNIEKIDIQFREKVQSLLSECSNLIVNCGEPENSFPHKITAPICHFKEMDVTLRDLLTEYLESDIEFSRDDVVLTFYNYWNEFTSALEYVEKETDEFFTSYYPKDLAIKITCCDASAILKSYYAPYNQIVGFSATLKPFKFYRELSGLHNKNVKCMEFQSPFPKSQRKLLVIPQISSKYSDRLHNYPRIVEVIRKISNLKKGNYFVFFPSFDFLEKILKIFPASDDFQILIQKRNMTFQAIQYLLTQLRDPNRQHFIFAVQGGVLAEGIDYPGNMIIGAMIVGVPLPMFDWEREQMKAYYETKYKAGMNYAYVFPAMAKSIQSSGRVIRSESDKGIIVLMDHRFLQDNYLACMPSDWFKETPRELISTAILKDVDEFWKNDAI